MSVNTAKADRATRVGPVWVWGDPGDSESSGESGCSPPAHMRLTTAAGEHCGSDHAIAVDGEPTDNKMHEAWDRENIAQALCPEKFPVSAVAESENGRQ